MLAWRANLALARRTRQAVVRLLRLRSDAAPTPLPASRASPNGLTVDPALGTRRVHSPQHRLPVPCLGRQHRVTSSEPRLDGVHGDGSPLRADACVAPACGGSMRPATRCASSNGLQGPPGLAWGASSECEPPLQWRLVASPSGSRDPSNRAAGTSPARRQRLQARGWLRLRPRWGGRRGAGDRGAVMGANSRLRPRLRPHCCGGTRATRAAGALATVPLPQGARGAGRRARTALFLWIDGAGECRITSTRLATAERRHSPPSRPMVCVDADRLVRTVGRRPLSTLS